MCVDRGFKLIYKSFVNIFALLCIPWFNHLVSHIYAVSDHNVIYVFRSLRFDRAVVLITADCYIIDHC
jgi:hypothetical protein